MIPAPSKGFRPDYSIGDTAWCTSHMMRKLSSEKQFLAVTSLKNMTLPLSSVLMDLLHHIVDYPNVILLVLSYVDMYIKRSDGSYSYAILAFCSLELPDDQQCIYADSLDECMTWVRDKGGFVKMLKKDQWAENVRLVSTDVLHTPDTTSRNNNKHRVPAGKEDWIPPSVISFVPVQHSNRPNFLD